MKHLKKETTFLNTKKKIYYGGVALIALVTASSATYAMNTENDDRHPIPIIHATETKEMGELSRVHCLWHLEQEPSKKRNYRAAALEIMEKEVLEGPLKDNAKLRINYLKKLGEFLKENPQHSLNLKILKPTNETEVSPLLKFYKETLNATKNLPEASESGLHTLKLKIFYSHLPQNLTKEDTSKLQQDIRKSFISVQRIPGINSDHLKYLRLYYFEELPEIQQLETLALSAPLTLLGGKINYKLGLNSIKNTKCNTAALSQGEHYYEKASKTPYSLVKYYLAELYNAADSQVANLYLPESAYTYYVDTVNEGANKQGKPLAAYPLAAYKLAKLLEKGDETFFLESNQEEALDWLGKAAKHGHPYAQYELAQHFMENQSTKKEGVDLLKQSAESGYSKAQLLLAQFYGQAKAKEPLPDYMEHFPRFARKYYKKAAEQGEQEAFYFAGEAHESEKNYDKAIYFYKKSTDPRAYMRLGNMCLDSRGYESSRTQGMIDQEAMDLFAKAAEAHYAEGNFKLGLMNLQGKGLVRQQEPERFKQIQLQAALDNFTLAANQNHPEAMFYLGIMNQFGIGTPQSYAKAKTFYESAANKDHAQAAYELGCLYKRGLGTEYNPVKALELWEKAAKLGNTEAAYKAGKGYLDLLNLEKDNTSALKAVEYLAQAVQSKHTCSFYFLGLIHELASKNDLEAIKCYKKSAEAGHGGAYYNLGKLYEKNSETKDKAFPYFEHAANHYHVDALSVLEAYYSERDVNKAYKLTQTLKQTRPLFQLNQYAAKTAHPESIESVRRKACKGNPIAQHYYGKLLETGVGVVLPQDMSAAIKFYQVADSKGNYKAKHRLEELKKIHVLEALSIEKNPTKTFSKEDEFSRVEQDPVSVTEELFTTPDSNVPSVELSQDNIDNKYESLEQTNISMICSYINAAEINLEEGHYNVAKHLEGIVQDKLDDQDALAIAKSINSFDQK